MKFLSEVDQGGEGEYGDSYQDEQQAELLVCLLQGVEQGLQAREVTDQLVHPQYSHYFDQSDDFPSLADYFEILESLKEQIEEEGNDSEEVDHVHRPADKFQFSWGTGESQEILQSEETDRNDVHNVDDLEQNGEINLAVIILLQLVNSRDDEGER